MAFRFDVRAMDDLIKPVRTYRPASVLTERLLVLFAHGITGMISPCWPNCRSPAADATASIDCHRL
jgi:hypothetical protein